MNGYCDHYTANLKRTHDDGRRALPLGNPQPKDDFNRATHRVAQQEAVNTSGGSRWPGRRLGGSSRSISLLQRFTSIPRRPDMSAQILPERRAVAMRRLALAAIGISFFVLSAT